ncbi:trehalose-phosphatase [Jiangella aurantiaca]|uniref:Trehalose 6-phosphate phosphatase n=1 Tax=Jiangella aurantiaca TaxID=2530373 RepID=A0A4R5A996_9ACTN|nr:trehalose-phosphatase [Jiangella aurantiaca]TDD67770.1 trehalose-phosphatase [Jiangella aurantiaca]
MTPELGRLSGRLDRTLVALDFDGVLSPIVPDPGRAVALAGTADVLTAVAARVARVAVVTGRPAAEAVRLGSLQDVPGLLVLGHYGLQRWSAGTLNTPDSDDGVDLARRRVTELAAARPGVTVEDKQHSVALHTRSASDPAAALDELRPHADAVAAEAGLQVTPGRFVLELRPVGVDKGLAIRSLVAETGATAVLYAGDDLGDLPAVVAVRELASSEDLVGIVVCSDAEEASAELRNAADVVVPGPPGVQALLRELATLD